MTYKGHIYVCPQKLYKKKSYDHTPIYRLKHNKRGVFRGTTVQQKKTIICENQTKKYNKIYQYKKHGSTCKI